MIIDLHVHSNNSDGFLSPESIFKIASNSKCRVLSITDHDFICDYSLIASKYGILSITGIEFNTAYKRMHILGYNIKDVLRVKKIMDDLAKYNEEVCLRVINMLKLDGFDISLKDIMTYRRENNINTSVINKKLIVKYLISKGYADSVKQTYDKLIGRNAPYYYPIYKLPEKEVIELIQSAGGIPVLAHPGTIESDENILNQLASYGLQGIELTSGKKYSTNNEFYESFAEKNNLITTYGSDFHDENDEFGINVEDKKVKSLVKRMGVKI